MAYCGPSLKCGQSYAVIMSRPNKKGFPIGPPTIGLETIPALNANINKNLKLIFLVRQRGRGLCCLNILEIFRERIKPLGADWTL